MSQTNEIEQKITERDNAFSEYCKNNKVKKLQIGSGGNYLDGWFNTDLNTKNNVYYLNLKEKFPFDDNTFDFIYSEHNIEHFTIDEGVALLKECLRVLKSNGKIRLATPDLKKLINYYNTETEINNKYTNWEFNSFIKKKTNINISTKAIVINNFYRDWGHKLVYDFETLKRVLEYSGFVDVHLEELGKSSVPELCGVERHLRNIENGEYNKIETMCVEGRKSEIVIMDFIEKLKSALPEEINFDDLYNLAPADLWKSNPRKAGVIALERMDCFDSNEYLKRYNDVRDANVNPIEHFINNGIEEKRLFFKRNSRNKYAIVFSISNNYCFLLCNALMSLKKNSKHAANSCDIIIYSDYISQKNKEIINSINKNCKYYNISKTDSVVTFCKNNTLPSFMLNYSGVKTRWGIYNLYKLAAYTLLDKYEKILILDVDIYINREIREIFKINEPIAWKPVTSNDAIYMLKKYSLYLNNKNKNISYCSGGVVLLSKLIKRYTNIVNAFEVFDVVSINKNIPEIDEFFHMWLVHYYNIPINHLSNIWNQVEKEKNTKIVHFCAERNRPWNNKIIAKNNQEWIENHKKIISLGIEALPNNIIL